MSYYTFDGKQVYYQELGDGAPLVLLHGNTASSAVFHAAAQQYARSFRVILIDFLGYGKSDRVQKLPADLWFYEAQQVIALLKERQYTGVNLLGSSGGALAAINAGLEAPELVSKVAADSFEGEVPIAGLTESLAEGREQSKRDPGAVMFYRMMHGEDWEQVVDCDTDAVIRHEKEIGRFFHRELNTFQPEILLTGSRQDEFFGASCPQIYAEMLKKIGHGSMKIFDTGGHPAMHSNAEEFLKQSTQFFLS